MNYISAFSKECSKLCKSVDVIDLIPNSAKVIVLDADLLVPHALEGLLDHNVNCAPIYDTNNLRYIGFLTVNNPLPFFAFSMISLISFTPELMALKV